MNIATIYTLYGRRAGAELLFEKTITNLACRYDNISFTIFCNKNAYDTLKVIKNESLNIRYERLLNNQLLKIFWLLVVSKFVINKKYDCFWIPSGTNSFPGNWPINSVVTFLDFGELKIPHKYDFKRTIYRKLICIPLSIKRGDSFTTISESTRSDLLNFFNKDSCLIYPGMSPRIISDNIPDHKKLIKDECGIDLHDKILFTPGRTDYFGKGLDTLVSAYEQLYLIEPDIPKLVFAGPEGEFHEKLIDKISTGGLSKNVYYVGVVSDRCIDALYKASLATIIPSKFEGFGFPPLESMFHKVPVICSNAGSLPEVVGDAAEIFQAGNVTDLFNTIRHILHNPSRVLELIKKGSERIHLFSWEENSLKMYELFKKTSTL
jgi:glycosyltransferase involved in cell wall biosynthesis